MELEKETGRILSVEELEETGRIVTVCMMRLVDLLKIVGDVELYSGLFEVITFKINLIKATYPVASAHAMPCFQYVGRSLEKFLAGQLEILTTY